MRVEEEDECFGAAEHVVHSVRSEEDHVDGAPLSFTFRRLSPSSHRTVSRSTSNKSRRTLRFLLVPLRSEWMASSSGWNGNRGPRILAETSRNGTEQEEVGCTRRRVGFAVPHARDGGEEGRMILYSNTNPESADKDDLVMRV
jgi:hypothetical protein